MQIQLTEKQFENLLKMTYLGNWLVNSCREEPVEEFEELEQLLWQLAKDSGMNRLTGTDPETGAVLPSPELEEILDSFIDEYDEEITADALAQQLAFRDINRELGPKVQQMSPEKLEKEALPLFQKYRDEFDKHGLDRLRIVP